jgi:hypothetical protein
LDFLAASNAMVADEGGVRKSICADLRNLRDLSAIDST